MAQVVERVGKCLEGHWFNPCPCHWPWSLCLWLRHFTHLALCECVWLLYVWGGGRRHWMAATLPSVCPRAAVATIVVYHHQYDCVNEWNLEPCQSTLGVLKSVIQIQYIIIMTQGLCMHLTNFSDLAQYHTHTHTSSAWTISHLHVILVSDWCEHHHFSHLSKWRSTILDLSPNFWYLIYLLLCNPLLIHFHPFFL